MLITADEVKKFATILKLQTFCLLIGKLFSYTIIVPDSYAKISE